jgi:hypothetical protein
MRTTLLDTRRIKAAGRRIPMLTACDYGNSRRRSMSFATSRAWR